MNHNTILRAIWAALVPLAIAALSPAMAQSRPAITTDAAAIETKTYDNWTVSCRAMAEVKSGKVCSGELKMMHEIQGKSALLLQWVFGIQNNRLMSVLSVPTGILLAPGIDLKIGTGRQMKIALSQCDPTHCEAVLPADEAIYKDLTLTPQIELTLILIDGRAMKYAVNMKGLDKALDDIRRNAVPTKAR